MSFVSKNRPNLDDIRSMPVGEIAKLPAEHLALLQEDADAALDAAKRTKEWLEALPDTIVIPVLGDVRREQVVKLIEDATLDDIAFALLGVEAEFSAVGDRLHALRKLYGIARQAGARGSECALDVASRDARCR
jgi:hypothetical protein